MGIPPQFKMKTLKVVSSQRITTYEIVRALFRLAIRFFPLYYFVCKEATNYFSTTFTGWSSTYLNRAKFSLLVFFLSNPVFRRGTRSSGRGSGSGFGGRFVLLDRSGCFRLGHLGTDTSRYSNTQTFSHHNHLWPHY